MDLEQKIEFTRLELAEVTAEAEAHDDMLADIEQRTGRNVTSDGRDSASVRGYARALTVARNHHASGVRLASKRAAGIAARLRALESRYSDRESV